MPGTAPGTVLGGPVTRVVDGVLPTFARLGRRGELVAHRSAAWTGRAAVEQRCREVLHVVPRLLGVAALTRIEGFEQRLAELTGRARQHHAERDLAALGRAVLEGGSR